jgi:SPP1 family predicted phage head-tail adaptor
MMFNRVLNLILENEKVEVYEKKTTVKPSGGTSIKWVKLGTILCNIQADHRYGEVLANSQSGDKINAVYNLYTRSEIKDGQRIKRDGVMYEIRHVEHNGRKTILEHYKGYLERVTQ